MKKTYLLIACMSIQFVIHAQNKNLKMDTLSYSLGVLIANNLKQQGFDKLSAPDLVEAIEDVLQGKEKINVHQANANLQTIMEAKVAKENGGVKEEGEKFLVENAKKNGIVSLPSGLQYEVMKMGDGPKPKATDKVKTHYHGTLINGKVFDSSVDRGEPISFPLNGVIKGWTEGLQLMPVGSKFRFFIPSNLAYGGQGAGADIKPFSTLIFEVELLGIE